MHVSSFVYLTNKKNNTTYVYDNVSTWNKTEKKCDCKRICIGKLDPVTKEIIYNKKHQPEDDVSTTKADHSQKNPEALTFGTTLLLDALSTRVGLRSVLKQVFPSDWKMLLSIAYYIISEGNALTHCEPWSRGTAHPYAKKIADQRISELLVKITPELQMMFYKRWMAEHLEDEYYALDITSVSSYSKQNNYVRYGYNRDGERLPQINICMLLGEQSKLPIYYKILPGSISDVSTLSTLLKELDWMDAKKLHVVMDRGFYSEKNIDGLYQARIKFTIGASRNNTYVKELIHKAKDGMEDYANYCNVLGNDLFIKSSITKWKNHRAYAHVCYDSANADSEYKAFLKDISTWENELIEHNEKEANRPYYEKYFTVSETPVRGRRITPNQSAINEFKEGSAGYFVLLSNDIKEGQHALSIYRRKDEVEKGIDDIKNGLDCKRLRIHPDAAMHGRLFIQFLALILSASIRETMHAKGLDKSHALPEIMNELKLFKTLHLPGKRRPVYTELTKFQKTIFAAFDIDFDSYV